VFVGWVAAVLGLSAERAHRKGFAAAGGALLGFCTLLIAQHLSASGDTMEMMRAVLDSNFWLGTHVVAVTIGYGSTFLAGALGVAWVLRRQLVAEPDEETTRALGRLRARARRDGHGRVRQRRDRAVLVRRQHARHRPALVRLHGQGLLLAVGF